MDGALGVPSFRFGVRPRREGGKRKRNLCGKKESLINGGVVRCVRAKQRGGGEKKRRDAANAELQMQRMDGCMRLPVAVGAFGLLTTPSVSH